MHDHSKKEWAKKPGTRWRVLAHDGETPIEIENKGVVDELVVDHWLHLEQMSEREWLLALGDDPEVAVWISIDHEGKVSLKLSIHGPSRISIPQ